MGNPYCCAAGAGDYLGLCVMGAMGAFSCNDPDTYHCGQPEPPARCNSQEVGMCCVPKN